MAKGGGRLGLGLKAGATNLAAKSNMSVYYLMLCRKATLFE
jgi:hypothetical protein